APVSAFIKIADLAFTSVCKGLAHNGQRKKQAAQVTINFMIQSQCFLELNSIWAQIALAAPNSVLRREANFAIPSLTHLTHIRLPCVR
ncbi:MAG: hypothetical protein LLG04_04025, partial [Parachlamydia sp.]|nr:hypothetical protein [Parachlamydia sp.]